MKTVYGHMAFVKIMEGHARCRSWNCISIFNKRVIGCIVYQESFQQYCFEPSAEWLCFSPEMMDDISCFIRQLTRRELKEGTEVKGGTNEPPTTPPPPPPKGQGGLRETTAAASKLELGMLLYFNEPETGKRIPGIVVGLNSDAAKERCLTDGWTKFQRWAKSNPPDYTKEYWIRPEDAKKGNVILFSTDGLFEVPRAWVSGCFPDDGQGALRSAILKSFSELCFARVQNVNPDTDSTERMAMIANLISLDSGYSVGMFETLSVYRLENGQYVVDELDNDKEKLLDDPLLAAREFEKMRGQRQLGFEFEKG